MKETEWMEKHLLAEEVRQLENIQFKDNLALRISVLHSFEYQTAKTWEEKLDILKEIQRGIDEYEASPKFEYDPEEDPWQTYWHP